jgi:hypothetical protein
VCVRMRNALIEELRQLLINDDSCEIGAAHRSGLPSSQPTLVGWKVGNKRAFYVSFVVITIDGKLIYSRIVFQ